MGNIPTLEQINNEYQRKSENQLLFDKYLQQNLIPIPKSYSIDVTLPKQIYTRGAENLDLQLSSNDYYDYNNRVFKSKANMFISAEFDLKITNFIPSRFGIITIKNDKEESRFMPSKLPSINTLPNQWSNTSTSNLTSFPNIWKTNPSLSNTSEGCKYACELQPQCVGWAEPSRGLITYCYLKKDISVTTQINDFNTRTINQVFQLKTKMYFRVVPGDIFRFLTLRACTILNGSVIKLSFLIQN